MALAQTRAVVAALVLALALMFAPGCSVSSWSFAVQPQVRPGSILELSVGAQSPSTGSGAGYLGAVIQVPLGFSYVSHQVSAGPRPFRTQVQPPAVAGFVAEPGYYLIGIIGYNSSITGQLTGGAARIQLKAPTAPGTYPFKVVILSDGGNVPAGVTQFAAITAAPHLQTTTVTAAHPDMFDCVAAVPVGGNQAFYPLPTRFADFDGDGRDDILRMTDAGPECWLTRPGATWTQAGVGLGGGYSFGMATGDFDGDGHADLVTTSGSSFFGDGTGGFVAGPPLGAGGGICTGDVDRDGRDDLVLVQQGAIRVLHGTASRTFVAGGAGLPSVPTPTLRGQAAVLFDGNGDGNLDLFVGESAGDNCWLGDGAGSWTAVPGIPLAATQVAACAIDLDGDQRDEVVVVEDSVVGVYRLGTGGFSPDPTTGFSLPTTDYKLSVMDVDADGNRDLLAMPVFGYAPELWRNSGSGTLQLTAMSGVPTSLAPRLDPSFGVGDFDGDGFEDFALLAFRHPFSVYLNMHTGLGTFGTGCAAGSLAAPTVRSIGVPQPGNLAFALQVQSPLPNTPGVFWLGDSKTAAGALSLPIDLGAFGAPGCTLWSEPEQIFALSFDASGNATVPLPVPLVPQLSLVSFFGQALVAAPGANAAGVLLGPGIVVRID